MKTYQFKSLLQADGWHDNIQIRVDESGKIQEIGHLLSDRVEEIPGFAVPGFQNAHSHAFQYAMAGLAEVHDTNHTSDDFWSWREAMYSLALQVNPDQMEAIATMLYAEMVRHGYTNVAEFHYVHHSPSGAPYPNLAEMGQRLITAARTAGIHITLVPIFYQKGGFGMEPTEGQRRFISPTIESYLKLLEANRDACKTYAGAQLGIGVHSMRAVDPSLIRTLAEEGPQDLPFHIHVSEQLKEIEDSIAYLGKRPVEWLLENVALNERFHLVHATHLTSEETLRLAKSGANVVLCPSTEGNLGDGLFPLAKFQAYGGKWSIGTDSHIGLNPLEELRILDYGQRLITHQRNTFAQQTGDSGHFALDMALKAGRMAMNNFEENYFSLGQPFNACIFDADAPLLRGTHPKFKSSALLYASDASHHWGTMIDGVLRSKRGQHVEHTAISERFAQAMKELGSRSGSF